MTRLTTLVYTIGFALAGLYGLRMLVFALLYPVAARRRPGRTRLSDPLPVVTVQIPLYNEAAVAGRVIDAVCRLRWPVEALEIQVLDDSTDETRALVDERVTFWRGMGMDIKTLRRENRDAFKAGALQSGLAVARGHSLAIFDADFVPPPDFLEACMPYLGPGVAAVQARWGHLNQAESLLTRAQSLALDGHFLVEQTCQSRLGLFTNFNGTAGIWQREAIDAAGGWQGDTLTEDCDLSYRAQLAGWRIVVLPEIIVPSELPSSLVAFARQQQRWAQGKAQVLRKLGASIIRAPLHPGKRLLALVSLSGYLVQPTLLILLLAAPLALIWPPRFPVVLSLFGLAPLGPPLYYLAALGLRPTRGHRRLLDYPVLGAMTAALALRIAGASIAGLAGIHRPFERTVKTGAGGPTDDRTEGPRRASDGAPRRHRPISLSTTACLEAALMVYALACSGLAVRAGVTWLAVYCGLFGLAFALMVVSGARSRNQA